MVQFRSCPGPSDHCKGLSLARAPSSRDLVHSDLASQLGWPGMAPGTCCSPNMTSITRLTQKRGPDLMDRQPAAVSSSTICWELSETVHAKPGTSRCQETGLSLNLPKIGGEKKGKKIQITNVKGCPIILISNNMWSSCVRNEAGQRFRGSPCQKKEHTHTHTYK